MLSAIAQRGYATVTPPAARPLKLGGTQLWALRFHPPFRTLRHRAIHQSSISVTPSSPRLTHRGGGDGLCGLLTNYHRSFHISETLYGVDSHGAPISEDRVAKGEKETSQDNAKVGQKISPKKEKAPADKSDRLVVFIISFSIYTFCAMAVGSATYAAQTEVHCNEVKEQEHLKKLESPEKMNPNHDYPSEDNYRSFIKKARAQQLETTRISERASLRFLDHEKALLLQSVSNLDVRLASMEECPTTQRCLRRRKKMLQMKIQELERISEALKVEYNLNTVRKLERWAHENRAALVADHAKLVRKIESSSPGSLNHEISHAQEQDRKRLEKELKDLDESDVRLKAIINGTAEVDSDSRFHKIKGDAVGESDGQPTKQ